MIYHTAELGSWKNGKAQELAAFRCGARTAFKLATDVKAKIAKNLNPIPKH